MFDTLLLYRVLDRGIALIPILKQSLKYIFPRYNSIHQNTIVDTTSKFQQICRLLYNYQAVSAQVLATVHLQQLHLKYQCKQNIASTSAHTPWVRCLDKYYQKLSKILKTFGNKKIMFNV
jgi:hypothetical protein